jgi:hypothetical protein
MDGIDIAVIHITDVIESTILSGIPHDAVKDAVREEIFGAVRRLTQDFSNAAFALAKPPREERRGPDRVPGPAFERLPIPADDDYTKLVEGDLLETKDEQRMKPSAVGSTERWFPIDQRRIGMPIDCITLQLIEFRRPKPKAVKNG